MTEMRSPDPKTAKQFGYVAEVIGEDATMKLCEYFGGVRFYVPRQIGPNNPIAVAIGQAAADKLAEYFHGTDIDLPKAYLGHRKVVEMKEQGYNARQIALATGYTDRHVRHILAAARDDDRQPLLPGL